MNQHPALGRQSSADGGPASLWCVHGSGHDPYSHLATERLLTQNGRAALFFWINQPCVVYGIHQNPHGECALDVMAARDILPVRRPTGGGAVYHDLNNLNVSLILPRSRDGRAQLAEVLLGAFRRVGIDARLSGRNDVLVQDRKVAGSAYCFLGDTLCCHACILLDADPETMAAVLTPPAAKLRANGVPSVRSRVGALRSLVPGLTMDALTAACQTSAQDLGYVLEPMAEAAVPAALGLDACQHAAARQGFADPHWLYGRTPTFSMECQQRFAWGSVTLCWEAQQGIITQAALYTDALHTDGFSQLSQALVGCSAFDPQQLCAALAAAPLHTDYRADVRGLLVKAAGGDGRSLSV